MLQAPCRLSALVSLPRAAPLSLSSCALHRRPKRCPGRHGYKALHVPRSFPLGRANSSGESAVDCQAYRGPIQIVLMTALSTNLRPRAPPQGRPNRALYLAKRKLLCFGPLAWPRYRTLLPFEFTGIPCAHAARGREAFLSSGRATCSSRDSSSSLHQTPHRSGTRMHLFVLLAASIAETRRHGFLASCC